MECFMKKLILSSVLAVVLAGCQVTEKKMPAPEKEKKTQTKVPVVKPAAKKPASKPAKKNEQKLAGIKIIGKTDKSALSYKENEEMIFTFRVDFGKSKPGKYFLRYIRRGDDNKTFRGKIAADKLLTVKTKLDRPGFVSVNVFLTDAKGRYIQALDYAKRMRPVAFYAGAGVKAETLKDCGEPKDFDAFWTKQKKRLSQVPFKGKVEKKLVREYKNGYVYAVSIPAPGPRPATGYMTVPKNAKPKSLPTQSKCKGLRGGYIKGWCT